MSANLKSDGFTGKEKYFRPSVAVDGVVLTITNDMSNVFELENDVDKNKIYVKSRKKKTTKDYELDGGDYWDAGELKVLLIKRKAIRRDGKKRPFYGYWALPGGFIRSMENAEKALERELVEEAQFYLEKNNIIPHQIGFYSNPKRDEYNFDSKDNPSLHKQVMSVAYAAILNKEVIPFSGSDAEEAKYFKVKEVLNGEINRGRLAFDHNQILKDSLSYISEKMKFTPIALDFLQEEFTIGEIRSVYEAFWSITDNLDSIDLSNFHKKVLSQKDQDGNPVILPSNKSKDKKRKQPGKGAPAKLYVRNKNSKEFSLVMSPTKKRVK
mgnify:CR=1 FL=1